MRSALVRPRCRRHNFAATPGRYRSHLARQRLPKVSHSRTLFIDLAKRISAPNHVILRGELDLWDAAVDLDTLAFDSLWQLGALGLAEARSATPRSEFLTATSDDGRLAGFSIVGAGSAVAYLQRVAVHPDFRGQGFGRSLVRAGLAWGRSHGGRTMMLNTQPENTKAATLYLSEGFTQMGAGLAVLRKDRPQ